MSHVPVRPGTEADEELPTGETGSGLVIAVLVLSAFVMILNETVLSVALRDLSVDLNVPTTTAQWLTSGFLLTMAVVIPVTGFLIDRFPLRRIFVASLGLFIAGTLLNALAPGFVVLLAGRILQACGTAIIIPLLMTSVMRLVPSARRGSMMGTITIVIAVAPALGPTVGGAVLSGLGWRWLFWVVLPLAVGAFVLGLLRLRVTDRTRPVALDVVSVVLSALGFGGLVYGLAAIGEPGGHRTTVVVSLAVGIVGIVAFVLRQLRLQRDGRALLDLRPLRVRTFTVCLIMSALMVMCLIGVSAILLPLYLQAVLGTSTFVSGLAVLPGGLALGLLGRPVGALYDRFGARPLVLPGAVAMAVALWLFTTLGPGSALVTVILIHVLLMVGLALMMTAAITEALSGLPEELDSHGSAILASMQQLAGAMGTALFVTVAAAGAVGAPGASGLRNAFVAAGCVGLLTVVTALFVRKSRPGTRVH